MAATSTGRAIAQEEPEALIRQGVELRRQGDDARAHGYFERAYSIAHTPRSAAQLGLVEQALGHFADAHEHLGAALASRDEWVNENRALLERSRAVVEAQLGGVQARGLVPGATVQIPGRPAMPLSEGGTVWVSPGEVTLTFAAPGNEMVTKQVVVSKGERLVVDVDLGPTKVPGGPRAAGAAAGAAALASGPAPGVVAVSESADAFGARQRRVWRAAGLAVAGTGLAVGIAGVVVYASGKSKLDAIKADRDAGRPYNVANGNFETLGNVGIGLAVTGGVALAAGACLYVLHRDASTDGRGARMSFMYLPGAGGSILLGGHF